MLAAALLLVILQAEGCYYMQAVRGHADLMSRRRPMDDVIADSASPDELRQKLELVNAARDFAVSALLLPDNDSYRSYADLERDYVVWNVFAAPEFALEPKTWCFPVAGCVAYRGYFSETSAKEYGERLADDGFDVAFGGVSAYSTLGRFSDPVLNTMMRWSDIELISTMFHELAHQKLYIKGDSEFNESFATAVENFGTERWLRARGELEKLNSADDLLPVREEMMSLVSTAREKLTELYAEEIDVESKRSRKADILDKLTADAAAAIQASGTDARNWLSAPLNNARLVSLNLYEGRTNAFRKIMDQCENEFACFYERAEEIAALPAETRAATLNSLAD